MRGTAPELKRKPEMPYAHTDVALFSTQAGDGEPLVLVHGSMSDHRTWALAAPALAASCCVIAYDRRGHGASEAPAPHGTRRDQEDDLARLIETLGRGPAHLAGSSYGGSIALGLASRRPELVRSVVAHEPPLAALVAADPAARPLIARVHATLDGVLALLERGEAEAGARRFVEEVALGPGTWDLLPEEGRATAVRAAPAFAAEMRDPDWASLDVERLAASDVPVLLTRGDASPAWFAPIVAGLARAVPRAAVHTFAGAGHVAHVSHPADYAAVVTAQPATV
jgi:pimeloyl-ACP methyl ester carboxylesterase